MSESADADSFIASEWRDALADAGASPADYHLIICRGAATTGTPKAVSYRRGLVLNGDVSEGGIVIGQQKLDEANRYKQLNRVATFEDWDEDDPVELALLAGLRNVRKVGRTGYYANRSAPELAAPTLAI